MSSERLWGRCCGSRSGPMGAEGPPQDTRTVNGVLWILRRGEQWRDFRPSILLTRPAIGAFKATATAMQNVHHQTSRP